MRILVTGAHGQVGTELIRQGQEAGLAMHGTDHHDLDICDPVAVQQAIDRLTPDAVINAAAWTAVDKAETERDAAFAVNRDGPRNLALSCETAGIPLLHISTDYVFDGRKNAPYVETDPVAPLGIYGASKLAGEEAVQSLCSRHLILRTSWVFSAHGNNFVKTMLRLGRERDELGIVADQHGKPTAAAEIARILLALATRPEASTMEGVWGLYHLAQPEATSWHGFAEAIFDEAHRQGIPLAINNVRAITTADYPTPAARPANSVLDCSKLEATFDVQLRPWQKSLAEVIAELQCNLAAGK